MKRFQNVFHLGIKELRGLRHDTVMLLLVIYAFSFGVYGPAKGTGTELTNASIAIVDEDGSQLAERIGNVFFPPAFQHPASFLFTRSIRKWIAAGLVSCWTFRQTLRGM